MNKLRAVLVGARGRMGRTILQVAQDESVQVVREIDLGDRLDSSDADVLIDFSQPGATNDICAEATRRKIPVVMGTTGHSQEQRDAITLAAKDVPFVLASNFSVGINALFVLAERAASVLPGFDIEVIEAHHRWKKDAPSGTAKTLAEILRRAGTAKKVRFGREGTSGERNPTEIGMHSIRGGDIVGEHSVILAGEGERLELTHRAASRETFARGALRAAHWIVDRPPGLYSMRDVLGL